MTSHSTVCPINTVSSTVWASNLKWSWLKTERRSPGPSVTLPFVGSSSPEITFRKVDLPAPLAPIIPYILPFVNFMFTSLYNTLFPNWTATFETVIISFYTYLKINRMQRYNIKTRRQTDYKRNMQITAKRLSCSFLTYSSRYCYHIWLQSIFYINIK